MGSEAAPPFAWEEEQSLLECVPDLSYPVGYVREAHLTSVPIQPAGYEVIFVLDGLVDVWMGKECFRGSEGDVLVVPPEAHHHEETPPGESVTAFFLVARFRDSSGARKPFPLPLPQKVHLGRGHLVEHLLWRLLAEQHTEAPGRSPLRRLLIRTLFFELARAGEGHIVSTTGFLADAPTEVEKWIRTYVRDHRGEHPTVAQMAHAFHLSREHFTRLFRRTTGETPHAFLMRLRMEDAKRYLFSTDLRIKEIAHRVGFSDFCYFSRAFKRTTGVSPTLYRRQVRAAESDPPVAGSGPSSG